VAKFAATFGPSLKRTAAAEKVLPADRVLWSEMSEADRATVGKVGVKRSAVVAGVGAGAGAAKGGKRGKKGADAGGGGGGGGGGDDDIAAMAATVSVARQPCARFHDLIRLVGVRRACLTPVPPHGALWRRWAPWTRRRTSGRSSGGPTTWRRTS